MIVNRGCSCPRARRAWQPDGVCSACSHVVLEAQLTPVLLQILCGGTGLVLWRNNSGLNTHWPDGRKRDAPIRYGIGPGGADWIGNYRVPGRRAIYVEVEMKSAAGVQSADQRAHQAIVERQDGVYAVVRTAEQAYALLSRLRTETQ